MDVYLFIIMTDQNVLFILFIVEDGQSTLFDKEHYYKNKIQVDRFNNLDNPPDYDNVSIGELSATAKMNILNFRFKWKVNIFNE